MSNYALKRLRAGVIDSGSYLDLKVDEAVAHIQHVLTPARLRALRGDLRECLESDPTLVDLVARVTRPGP
jgi:hypothetical protein